MCTSQALSQHSAVLSKLKCKTAAMPCIGFIAPPPGSCLNVGQ